MISIVNSFFSKHAKLKKMINFSGLAIILVIVVKVLLSNLLKINWQTIQLDIKWIVFAIILETLVRSLTGVIWNYLFEAFDSKIPVSFCISVSFVSLLGKYIPGRIAYIASVIYLFSKYEHRKIILTIVPLVFNVITVETALILCVPFFMTSHFKNIINFQLILGFLVILGLFFLSPRFIINISNFILKKIFDKEINVKTKNKKFIIAVILIIFQCALAGLSLWMILVSFHPISINYLPIVFSIGITANIIGFMAFFTPAGLGAREGIYLLFLSPLVGGETVSLASVILRIIITFLDLNLGFFVLIKNNKLLSGKKKI